MNIITILLYYCCCCGCFPNIKTEEESKIFDLGKIILEDYDVSINMRKTELSRISEISEFSNE